MNSSLDAQFFFILWFMLFFFSICNGMDHIETCHKRSISAPIQIPNAWIAQENHSYSGESSDEENEIQPRAEINVAAQKRVSSATYTSIKEALEQYKEKLNINEEKNKPITSEKHVPLHINTTYTDDKDQRTKELKNFTIGSIQMYQQNVYFTNAKWHSN